jgi:acyl carrier protein
MTRSELSSRLADLAAFTFNQPRGRFTESTKAADIPRWDSLNHVKLLIAIEEEFDLQFVAADLNDPETWGGFVDMIAAKLKARG